MTDPRVEALAVHLYRAWVEYDRQTNNPIAPKWFALRDDLKAVWLNAAVSVLAAYGDPDRT